MNLSVLYYAKDSPRLPSGYGKCVREIAPRLNKKYPTAIYYTVPLTYYHDSDWEGVPCYAGMEDQMRGEDAIQYTYRKWQEKNPDTVSVVWIQMCAWVYQKMPEIARQIPIVLYAAVDFYPFPQYVIDSLGHYIRVVGMNRWARDELRKTGLNNVSDTFIYHGIDPKIYKPLAESKSAVKKEYAKTRKSMGAGEDDFLITIVAVNQNRKAWAHWIEGIKLFREDNPDMAKKTKIYAQTQAIVKDSYNLIDLFHFHGLEAYLPEPLRYYHGGFSEEDMARIYNVSDCLLIPAAEGFSMPTIEAMACGCPVIGLDFGSQKELIEPLTPELLTEIRGWYTFNNLLRKPLPDPEDIARKLKAIADRDPEYYYRKLPPPTRKKFNWDHITPKFSKVLEEVAAELERRCVKLPKSKLKSNVKVIE